MKAISTLHECNGCAADHYLSYGLVCMLQGAVAKISD